MAEDSSDKVGDGKLDLVPMIDCIMLLLLFFILTTKFTPQDLALASLLPTDTGARATPQQRPAPPPQQIMLGIVPAGMAPGLQPSQYLGQLHALEGRLPAGGISTPPSCASAAMSPWRSAARRCGTAIRPS